MNILNQDAIGLTVAGVAGNCEAVGLKYRSRLRSIMWDNTRKIVWLTVAITAATFFAFQNAKDDRGTFDPGYFALLELIFLSAVALMFYMYSRKN